MISHRLGQKTLIHQIGKQVQRHKLLSGRLASLQEHLAVNGIDLEKTEITLGAELTIDPKQEQFIDNPGANTLLTRAYRQPFVVPTIG